MLPAPARIAAPPRPTSRGSWKPAVPPPPVAGAAAGNGLADGLAGATCVSVGVGVGVGESLGVGLGLAESVAVLLTEIEGVGEAVPPGENDGDGPPAEGVDPEQAERVMEASNAMVPQPVMANLALSPVFALVVRTFMEPPHVATRPLAALAEDIPETAGTITVQASYGHAMT
jgi:hypothetical protein